MELNTMMIYVMSAQKEKVELLKIINNHTLKDSF
jgi:hypothetical protein